MRKKSPVKLFVSLLFVAVLLMQWVVPSGCANQVPPLGGPRDSLPPVLLGVRPPDSARNFNSKKIVFEFNEYVQLENVTENLLVSPTPKISPQVEHKLRTITVTIKDTLEPNTTYSYNFGNAIKDINESNVLKGFSYTFSTGNTLDSLSLSGTVIVAETGKTDTTIIIGLYKSGTDSIVKKEKPRYITRVDRNGNYQFRNLPAGTFYIYAIKDNAAKIYLDSTDLFAFADKPINTGAQSVADTLYAYAYKPVSKPPAAITRTPGGRNANPNADKRLRIETNLENNELDLLKQLEVYFKQAPLKEFDSSRIRFTDEKYNVLKDYTIVKDTSNSKITLQYKWVENMAYALIVEKEFATDTAGRQLPRTDTLEFRTKKQSAYGSIRWRFTNLDLSRNPVLLLVQGEELRYSFPLSSREFTSKLFVPGDYELRILYDDNKNGKWDPGRFFGEKRQPERVVQVPRKITIKANWDNESDFSL